MTVVAVSRAKTGGPCPDCGMPIGKGNSIYKYPVQGGGTTVEGNGPGIWVCRWCHTRRQLNRGAGDDLGTEENRFECDGCGRYANPVVESGGRRFCWSCWSAIRVEQGHLP